MSKGLFLESPKLTCGRCGFSVVSELPERKVRAIKVQCPNKQCSQFGVWFAYEEPCVELDAWLENV